MAELIGRFEDERAAAAAERRRLLAALDADARRKRGVIVGFTGAPGCGKSTLLGQLALGVLARQAATSVCVLAVDPSSRVSGGALLGDRTRVRLPIGERRVFFRSQASASETGGLGPATFQVCRLLHRLFDIVLVETVGVGQAEADIRLLASRVYLVLPPLAGDEVQFLKAGIMEIGDAFVQSKSDEPKAERSYHALRGVLALARPDGALPPIFRTSARTGEGVEALLDDVLAAVQRLAGGDLRGPEAAFFARWVRGEWGRAGEARLTAAGGAAPLIAAAGGFEAAQVEFAAQMGATP